MNSGFIPLVALSFLIVANVPLQIPKPEPKCVAVQGFEYAGRDDEGRPQFNYPMEEKCYGDTIPLQPAQS